MTPAGGTLVHRYSFNETTGTTAADSIGGSSWDGALVGSATFSGGQLVLDGASGYAQLPPGVVSGMDAVTIEAWVSFGSPINTWSALYSFGKLDSAGPVDYISLGAHTGAGEMEVNFGTGAGTSNLERTFDNQPLDGVANAHVVAVYYPLAGYIALYTNGVLAAATANNQVRPVLYQSIYNVSSVNYVLGAAPPNNLIGASLYPGDPLLNASIDEFRIYNGPLTAAQISADHALGPNQLIGSNTSVSLTAAVSGSNLVLTWPTNSALVTLTSSSNLGSGGAWPAVNQPLTIAGGKYQVTVPVAGAAQYFRLEK